MLHSTRKSAWQRRVLLAVAAVLVMTIMAACGAKNDEKDSIAIPGAGDGKTVATYKDGEVTQPEFDKYLNIFSVMNPGYEQIITIGEFKEELLKQYVAYKVLGAEASKDTVKDAKEQADSQFEQFKAQLEKDQAAKDAMAKAKVTNDDIKAYMNLMLTVVTHMNSKVTEDDMKAEFDKNKSDYDIVSVRHILIGTTDPQTKKEMRKKEDALKRAKEVKAKLEAGGDWNKLAKEYSDDTGSKDKGGLYEDAQAKGWVEGFKKAATTQEVGKIGEPVETEFGYHVMKVEKRTSTEYAKLDEATKEELKSGVAYALMNKFMTEDLTKLDLKITLPKDEKPAASPDASAAPSPDASASPEATASPAAK
ncbi:peptidylprolyl isomerase [Paenibacillus sp. GCM10023252]|uniref:peptidylprolyl isomerase n=1 Tax=Paenibacillus sp. GCM10023252 TaxID=3252649 RepID=UPI00360AD2C9